MRKSKEKEREYKSMEEFEMEFFPDAYKEKAEKTIDIQAESVALIDEYLEKIKNQLVK